MALSQLFWDVLMPWNLKSTYFSLKIIHFLSLNIWYVIYVVFWIKYWNLKLPHHCILFLFTICTVSQLFWNRVCTSEGWQTAAGLNQGKPSAFCPLLDRWGLIHTHIVVAAGGEALLNLRRIEPRYIRHMPRAICSRQHTHTHTHTDTLRGLHTHTHTRGVEWECT